MIKKYIKKVFDYLKKEKKIPIYSVVRNEKLLYGKVAFITGGSGGIGYAIAKKYIESGCKVIITGTNEDKLKKYSIDLGENCRYILLNLNEIEKYDLVIKNAINFFGKIDILVNCAGIHTDRIGLDFLNITEKEYDEIMDLNLKSIYFISQKFAQYMINNKIKGHILMISSQSALEPSWSPYRLSKRGLSGITIGLAQNLIKYGIIVNGIGPGPTATAMQKYENGDNIFTTLNPIYRYTMPNEVAEYALLLGSELGNTIVGDTIYMSGGRGIIELR